MKERWWLCSYHSF